ncbi:MAG: hypothetical protein GEV07_00870 [Streptosporangiales bacterium]|nr:hypothetical protein [Streptosporangiales bacterium]
MARRVSLPGADEFFGCNGVGQAEAAGAEGTAPVRLVPGTERAPDLQPAQPATNRRGSGREKHDEKITVYVSSDELFDLEHARLVLRRHHGLTADRGRIVREAVAALLEDLEEHGGNSVLVQRLRDGL